MARLRVQCFSLSLDGFGAGPGQSLESPLGKGGEGLHQWFFPTLTFQSMLGNQAGTTGVDNDYAVRGFQNVGAWVLGRNMFGPIRGSWPDESWRGWWGDSPPYHTPVFVLTHHPRKPLEMEGGTTFHFVTDGVRSAYRQAMAAAGGQDVRLGGGVDTIRQFLLAGLIDELHLVISRVLLGSGENLLGGINMVELGYQCVEHTTTENATHVVLRK
jgi:dihydrofolate reductase